MNSPPAPSYGLATDARRRALSGYQQEGARIVGIKISLTSAQAQARVGTDRPIWGWLTDRMQAANGAVVAADSAQLSRAEPELVFVLGSDLAGPGVSCQDVLSATAAICAGLELPAPYVGSQPTVADVISRNALAGRFVVGPPVMGFRQLDLTLLGVLVEVDGVPVESGCAANVLGHPAQAVAAAVNDLAASEGHGLHAGQLIFSGGLAPPVPLAPATTVEATFAHLGRVGISVAEHSSGRDMP